VIGTDGCSDENYQVVLPLSTLRVVASSLLSKPYTPLHPPDYNLSFYSAALDLDFIGLLSGFLLEFLAVKAEAVLIERISMTSFEVNTMKY